MSEEGFDKFIEDHSDNEFLNYTENVRVAMLAKMLSEMKSSKRIKEYISELMKREKIALSKIFKKAVTINYLYTVVLSALVPIVFIAPVNSIWISSLLSLGILYFSVMKYSKALKFKKLSNYLQENEYIKTLKAEK